MADDTLQGDLSQFDTREQAYGQEVAQVGATMREGAEADVQQADAAGAARIARAEEHAASIQPFTQEGPQDQINKVMAGAPFLFALTALGGKASKINGMAMLEGLNGVSAGILAGNKDALDQNWKRYDAAFEKWKTTADLQDRVFKELDAAYSGAADGSLRAHMAAHAITNDTMQMQLTADDPKTWADIKSKVIDSHAKLMDARAKMAAAGALGGEGGFDDPRIKAILAKMTDKGVKLTGFRSRQQMLSQLQGLIQEHPDETADQIAERVKKGQLTFTGEQSAARAAGTVAGRVEVAGNEIRNMSALVRDAAAKVPRAGFIPINQLFQIGEKTVSPELRALKIRINSMLNAYDLLAARGGTDKDKRKAVRELIMTSDTPEILEAAIDSFNLEVDAAEDAAQAVIEQREPKGATAPNKQVNFHDLP
jgi:hypothetical protein